MKIKLFFAFAILSLILYFIKFPVIFDESKYAANSTFDHLKKNDVFTLGKRLKVTTYNEYKLIYIINDRNDVSDDFRYGKVFTTSDPALIEKFLTIKFTYTGSDIATAQNQILLYKNNKCIFRSSIVADDESEGLQSFDFGWVQSAKKKNGISNVLRTFDNNYSPIVFLK
ncbi:hypothetical protein CHRY9390_00467 [Chryseobacterium aquaeductus]|uniref:Uncharacterized protein n=1 Tax=Chryseobacterium aquaeductus TaxID=2675056 RepID=A0A9N8QRB4_9FLAO|nr:hypothetical protein [Chryseobacterium aquaeductus]CAA7329819.1 hypothetical protein CHRY9390_00467 [Chryseobacterium potabilaquae]CAD7799303.1 hypothetical protein CHRY9390_00467 [Chryseobacterium aquaeductus]